MRRDKTTLLLMEQLVALLVFALAAAVCLQAFAAADRRSRQMEARDRAAALCQSAAETLRHSGGDIEAALEALNGTAPGRRDGFGIFANYGDDWAPLPMDDTPRHASYTLRVEETAGGVPGLGGATVTCYQYAGGKMEALFSLDVAWQEVTAHG